MPVPTRILVAAGAIAGLIKLAISPDMEVPAVAVAFGALFCVMAAWAARGRSTVPVVVLVLGFAVELAGLPFYTRETTLDHVVQFGGAVAWVAGLGAAAVVLARRRRATRHVTV